MEWGTYFHNTASDEIRITTDLNSTGGMSDAAGATRLYANVTDTTLALNFYEGGDGTTDATPNLQRQ